MSEYDDPILRDRLSRYAGAPPDSDAAYVGVQQRVRHVKRRRVAIWSSAAVIVIGVGTANALQGPDGAKVTVPPTASTPVANTVATSPSTTSTSTTTTATPPVTTTAVTTTAVAAAQPAPPEITNPEAALGNPDSGDAASAPAGAPPVESATASRPAELPAEGEEFHRSSTGGTVGIRLRNGSLSLVSATPNEGYTVHVDDDSGSRVRVVFVRRAASSTVTATVVDGEVRFRVRERGGGDQDDRSGNGGGDDSRDNDRDSDDGRDDGRDDDWPNRGDD